MGGNISLFAALSYRHSGTNQITGDFVLNCQAMPAYVFHPRLITSTHIPTKRFIWFIWWRLSSYLRTISTSHASVRGVCARRLENHGSWRTFQKILEHDCIHTILQNTQVPEGFRQITTELSFTYSFSLFSGFHAKLQRTAAVSCSKWASLNQVELKKIVLFDWETM